MCEFGAMQPTFYPLKPTASASFDPAAQDQVRQSSEIIAPGHEQGHRGSAGRKGDPPRVSAQHFVTACVIQDTGGKKKRKAAGLGAETEGRVVGLFIFSS